MLHVVKMWSARSDYLGNVSSPSVGGCILHLQNRHPRESLHLQIPPYGSGSRADRNDDREGAGTHFCHTVCDIPSDVVLPHLRVGPSFVYLESAAVRLTDG